MRRAPGGSPAVDTAGPRGRVELGRFAIQKLKSKRRAGGDFVKFRRRSRGAPPATKSAGPGSATPPRGTCTPGPRDRGCDLTRPGTALQPSPGPSPTQGPAPRTCPRPRAIVGAIATARGPTHRTCPPAPRGRGCDREPPGASPGTPPDRRPPPKSAAPDPAPGPARSHPRSRPPGELPTGPPAPDSPRPTPVTDRSEAGRSRRRLLGRGGVGCGLRTESAILFGWLLHNSSKLDAVSLLPLSHVTCSMIYRPLYPQLLTLRSSSLAHACCSRSARFSYLLQNVTSVFHNCFR